jgi:hypothetical protein
MDTQDKTAMVMNAKEAAIKAKEAKDKEENYTTFMKDATKMAIDKGYEPGTKQFELAKTGYFNALKNSYEGVPTKNINVSTTKREGRVFKKDKTQSKSVLPEEAEIIKQDIIDFKNGYLKDHPKATPDEITKAAESKFGKIEFK